MIAQIQTQPREAQLPPSAKANQIDGAVIPVLGAIVILIGLYLLTKKKSGQQINLKSKISVQNTSKLKTELVRLLHGDMAAANRLVNGLKAKNPDKDESWCWQRAIEQLERDRY